MAQKRPPSPSTGMNPQASKRRRPQRTGVASQRHQNGTPHRSFGDLVGDLIRPKGSFKYTKLTKHQLRLLDLHPARDRDDSIVCELRTVQFSDLSKNPYDALSYTWGGSEPTREISIRLPSSKWHEVLPKILQIQKESSGEEPGSKNATNKDSTKEASSKEKKPLQRNFYITRNLETALRHFREDEAMVTLWVDAICIDQDNEEEKGHQVARMAEVYCRANAVRVWLGESDPDTKGVTDFARDILDLSKLEHAISSPDADPRPWHQLSQLMRREWFTRRWVVQELALAQEAFLHVGDEDLHWDDFVEAVALFAQEAKRIEALFALFDNYQYVGDVRLSGAFQIIEMTNNLFRWAGGSSVDHLDKAGAERLIPLEELVSQLVMFDARDPRDTIFALLSLARDIPSTFDDANDADKSEPADLPQPLLIADYTTNELDVFKDFIAFCCMKSGSLDIICRHWAPNIIPLKLTVTERHRIQTEPDYKPKPPEELNLPSWIPLLRESAFTPPSDGLSGSRRAADDLVGKPNHRRYRAAGDYKAVIWFGEIIPEVRNGSGELTSNGEADTLARPKDSELRSSMPPWTPGGHNVTPWETLQNGRNRRSDGCMYVLGFRSGTICKLSARLLNGDISKEALDMSGWTVDMEEACNLTETIWRSFVGDRDKHNNNPPLWYRRALLTCIAERDHTDDIHLSDIRKSTQSVPMHNFLDRLEAVLWNKKLMHLRSDNDDVQFGIAPHKAEEGDIVCILLGCSVPVVLREIESSNGKYYQFIGEVYVYNLMAGEALRKFEGLDENEVQREATEFRLR